MPFFDVDIRVEAKVRLTSWHRVTVEARDADEAARLAEAKANPVDLAQRSIHSLEKGREFDPVSLDGAELAARRVVQSDFSQESPEERLFGQEPNLSAMGEQGVSNGHIVLWTKQAAALRPRTTATHPLPDDIRALVARYDRRTPPGRHPGFFFPRYVDAVRQLYCALLGDAAGGPALIVDLLNREVVGALMPMNVEAAGASAVPAPELPEGWLEGEPPREVAFDKRAKGRQGSLL